MTDERIKEDDFINIKGLKFKSPFDMMKWITKAVAEIKKLKVQNEVMKEMLNDINSCPNCQLSECSNIECSNSLFNLC